jgi:hypothetical protein
MSPDVLHRKQRTAVFGISVLVGLTRFIPLSLGPWDWDEVLFCLAIGDYNVAAHQPHPAGFPLFILLAKLARFFANTDFHALQTVNVLASIFLFSVVFAVARALRFDFLAALAAGLLFVFLPNVWFYGGTAFSDPLGLLLFFLAIAAYLNAGTSTRRYLIASVIMAAGILVRPQNLVVALFPWTIATVRLWRARNVRGIVAGTLAIVLLVAIGYGIAAYVTGFEAYVYALRGHSAYVARADSIASEGRPPFGEVLLMQLNPFDAGKVAWAMNLLALAAIVAGRRRVVAEVLLTFLPFFLFCAVAANPGGTSRFSLIYLGGVVLLVIEGTDVLARLGTRIAARIHTATRAQTVRIGVYAAVLAVLLGRLITWGLPAFEKPRTTLAPPTAAALWLRDRVPLTDTIFVDNGMQPWVKYYASNHRRVVVSSTWEILKHPAASHGWYIALAPPPSAEAIGFFRPRNRTWNIVTKRGFEAFVQPTRDVVGFGDGWYDSEDNGISTWRWSARRATVLLGPTSERRELRLRFLVPVDVYKHPLRVTLTVDGRPMATVLAQSENDVRFLVQGHADRASVLKIDMSDSFVPARGGKSVDRRELGIMLLSCTWQGVGR